LGSKKKGPSEKKTSVENSVKGGEYPETPRLDPDSNLVGFLDSRDDSENKQDIDKKIERIIQKYDKNPNLSLSQNSGNKSRETGEKYGSPGLSNISEKNGNQESQDSGFLDPEFLKFLEEVDWEKEANPARKAKKLELYKQLFELDRGKDKKGLGKFANANFKKKSNFSLEDNRRVRPGEQGPFSKITEEQSLESGGSKIPTLKDLQEGKTRQVEQKSAMDIQGNYADLVRMNTSQSLKDFQGSSDGRESISGQIQYKSDRINKKGKSFLMEFENKTKTSMDQKELSERDPNEKIKRLIETSYSKDHKNNLGFSQEQSLSRDPNYESENMYEKGESDMERRRHHEEESDIQLGSRGSLGSGEEDRQKNRKFRSKKEEYKKSREVLMKDIQENGLRGDRRRNFLDPEHSEQRDFRKDRKKKFLSPPKGGIRGGFKKPKQQEMNYYEQEDRKRQLADITREFYPVHTKKSRRKSKNKSNYLLDKAFKKKNYGNTYSKVDTGRFTGKYKFDKKLRDHYALQEDPNYSQTVNQDYSQTYTVSNLLQKGKHMKPLHRNLKPIYDNLNYTDGIRKNNKRDFGNSGKLHRNMCWNFEEEHQQKKKDILKNYYRDFDS
jgi:hypothetical protein